MPGITEGLRTTQFPAAIAATSGDGQLERIVPGGHDQHNTQGLPVKIGFTAKTLTGVGTSRPSSNSSGASAYA